jgi:hypothetical protein
MAQPEMTAAALALLIQRMKNAGIAFWLDGGWGWTRCLAGRLARTRTSMSSSASTRCRR